MGGGSTAEEKRAEALHEELRKAAEEAGYHLNPDREFVLELAGGLLENERRYGYRACPCRLASGSREDDLDIVCPCDYRDPDLEEFGACYCALYVSGEVARGEKAAASIPERRSSPDMHAAQAGRVSATGRPVGLAYPVWRCKVCGYLCAREKPPEVCPICKAKKDRFERFF